MIVLNINFRYVEISETDEDDKKKVFEEDVAINDVLEKYYDSGRHSMSSTANGDTGMDYILRISGI